MNWAFLPNAITLARIGLVPPLWWLLYREQFAPALVVALVAGLSDALDGGLAKRYGWQSRLGGLLDPIADKLLLAACFVGLWSAGALPDWLLLLVLGRDLVIVAGAVAWNLLIGPLEAQPTLLSKFTTAVQIILVLLVMAKLAFAIEPGVAATGLIWLAAALTAISGLDYVVRWSCKARIAKRKDRP
ncbi:MAG TPA: CDP-alcohol phosphatidyltransferase [Xanthomonadales bacterium]|nr:CDP-alcohol phosphatidyltransferase [Xanthomonadales bacterium]